MSATTTLIGRLVKEIEIKQSGNNKEYGLIRLAVRRTYKNKNGEYPSDFYTMPVFGEKQIKNLKAYTTKGSLIAVHGTLETNTTTDNNQSRTYINIIPNNFIFLANPKKSNNTDVEKELDLDYPVNTDNPLVEEIDYQNEIPNYVFNADEQPFH